jgi:hypothetical protein
MASLPKPPPPPRPKSRGSYNCGRCGQPKKGHVCVVPAPVAAGAAPSQSPSSSSGAAGSGTGGGDHRLRRALSFDEAGTPSSPEKKLKAEDVDMEVDGAGGDEETMDVCGRPVPMVVMAEVLRRLGPRGVMSAAEVSCGWRDCAGRVWRATEELRLRAAGLGLLGAVLPRCTALARLELRMER